MENTWVGWKKRLESFFDWYIRSDFGFLATIVFVSIWWVWVAGLILDRRAEIIGHPSYISKNMNVWVPQGAIFGNFVEGGLAFHKATFSEMMADEKKFPNYFISCDTISPGSVICNYYAKGENSTHAYRATFRKEKHNYSNGWWTFKTTEIEMREGSLFEKGDWEHGYAYISWFLAIVLVFDILAVILVLGARSVWKKRQLKNFS